MRPIFFATPITANHFEVLIKKIFENILSELKLHLSVNDNDLTCQLRVSDMSDRIEMSIFFYFIFNFFRLS